VQIVKEMREITVELSAREVPVDYKILHREVPTDPESDTNLHILAREHTTFDEYVQEVSVLPLLVAYAFLITMVTDDRREGCRERHPRH